MTFTKLMIAAASLVSTMAIGVTAEAKDHRRHDHRYEQSYKNQHRGYRSDRDRRYDRSDRDRRRDWRSADRRRDRSGNNSDVARRNYEYERDLQTCYRNGRRICP